MGREGPEEASSSDRRFWRAARGVWGGWGAFEVGLKASFLFILGGFKTAEIYPLTVLEAKSLK